MKWKQMFQKWPYRSPRGSQQWDHQLVAERKVGLGENLEACQRLYRANQSIGYLRVQSDTEILGRSGTIWRGNVVPTVLEFGEEYIMIHSDERLGKIDKQGADRATLIQGTAPGLEDRD